MTDTATLENRLERFIAHHLATGQELPVAELCAGRPDLAPALQALIGRYLSINESLTADPVAAFEGRPHRASSHRAPSIPGFEVIERIGAGGMGEVYKVRDLTLHRTVAAKVIRTHGRGGDRVAGFLREARALALFSDPRIVRIYEAHADADPPVLVMELVEGFELRRIARSLDRPGQARLFIEICEAVHHAHTLGIQHRDLKPANIMVDAELRPRILDFGISGSNDADGHFIGTPPYMAPEQMDPSKPIDARTDVYALGVILYELLCGAAPHAPSPRLPVEVDATVPEPLQRIALAAMEPDPSRRYQSAGEMAADLRRYLDGGRVTARPSLYETTLASRVAPHLEAIGEWLRLRLIHRHEADRLREAYAALDARDDEWIVEARALSYTQIALYLGAFLLVCGSLFYFVAARWHGAVEGLLRPLLVLALPFAGLNATAHLLYRREHKAVAIAFYLAAVGLLPMFLLILFHEAGWLVAPADTSSQLFENGAVSNRQLQVTTFATCAWSAWLALRTRTSTLSTVFTALLGLFALAVAGDFGLRGAIEDGRWDHVAGLLFPIVALCGALGYGSERSPWPSFSRPAYLGAAGVFMAAMELLALDGRLLEHVGGFSLAPWQPTDVTSPRLLDTVVGMTFNGAVFYGIGSLLTRSGLERARPAAQLLYVVAPFALLHPLGYLVRTGEYAPRFDWLYALCALGVMLLSERRQRRSFYYAGVLNLGLALFFVALHREWFDRPWWAIGVIVAGLAALAIGFVLDRRSRRAVALILLSVQPATQQPQQPTFKSGTELVRIDTQVVGRDGTPLKGLRPDQFEVFVDGRRRPVTLAEFVRASEETGAGASANPAAATPFPGGGRVIVIAVDQASFPFAARASAIEAARRVVQRAAPEDYVGIVVFPDTAAVAPTRERQPVLDAIGKIVGLRDDLRRPLFNISAAEATALRAREGIRTQELIDRECQKRLRYGDPTCRDELLQEAGFIVQQLEHQAVRSITGLDGVLAGMETLPGRKTLMVLSAGLPMSRASGAQPDPSSAIEAVARRAAAANINLYVLYMNVHFLRAFSAEYGRRHNSLYDDITMFGYGLERFADSGGGAFFQVEVDSDPFVDRALRETSAAYVLGVEVRPEDRDGKPHFIRVAVKQRGATVRYRKVVIIPKPPGD